MPARTDRMTRSRRPAAGDPRLGGTMSGPIGLHGGGEYLAGDEPFLDALLEAASIAAAARAAASAGQPTPDGAADVRTFDVSGHAVTAAAEPIRVVILPTAAARGVPDRAAATGRDAFVRRAAAAGRRVVVEVARVVDAASADDPRTADRLAGADLIHLPGGDPDLVPAILGDSRALAGLEAAWRRGAVIAGASAGAMALAEWTWTPGGGIRGLGLVAGLAVVPHYDEIRRTRWQVTLDELAPGEIGYLGLDERTGVLSTANGSGATVWRVAGPGAAYWFDRGASEPRTGRHGDLLGFAP
ncbi:MAG TPA: Type 1 glutamine amidotransferase-like domain-containing protein [Candidatus Limnocylindrales bacterium]|nr:Type 1 glutamine amidotransferase-like domain-containing protein [Candidatus Limnocylindrales bacterium]